MKKTNTTPPASPVSQPMEFGAEVYGPASRASVSLWPLPPRNPTEPDRIQVHLSWTADDPWVAAFEWRVSRNGTRDQVIAFLEEWVPKCPGSELLNKALVEASAKIPEGVL
jgi:hypothetical protein